MATLIYTNSGRTGSEIGELSTDGMRVVPEKKDWSDHDGAQ